ncbi:retrovirus-related pol polyprotein from transposon TNT 1-94 [Tanacetum coccineum]
MVLREVLMKSGLVSINTARQNILKTAVLVNTTRQVNTAHSKTIVNAARQMSYLSKIAHSTVKRPINKNTAKNRQIQDKGVIDSGCSMHMTRNMSYVTDYEEIDGGYVAFGGNPRGAKITGKCTIKTVPKKNNMYSVDLKNIVPKRGLTCLFGKATSDESKLWHRRIGHLNFKTMNKLVKGNLVRGLPSKLFENDEPMLLVKRETSTEPLDETSGILKSFITGIENLVDHKVKVIRCDNEIGFKNREMNQFCEKKGILRQFSVARTPQQNRVAERRNMTLIEAARTMLADSKLPTTFWADGVNTAYYVQNRMLVVKPHNKTPYELFHCRTPTLSFMRPFGCPVIILNTIDHLGKFDGKADEGFFVGYSLNSKAFRVFNSRTRIVEENLHIRFSENTPNVAGNGLDWLFDIDALTRIMNYEPIVAGTQANSFTGIKASDNAGQARQDTEPKVDEDPRKDSESNDQEKEDNVNRTNNVNVASTNEVNAIGGKTRIELPNDPNMPALEDYRIFDFTINDEDNGVVADMNNLDTTIQVSPIPTTRIHKDHPHDQVIGDLQSATQIKNMLKNLKEHGFVSTIQKRTNHKDLQNCLFTCFLSQEEPKKVFKNKKDERGIMIRNKARLVPQGYTQEEGSDYDEVSSPIARIEAIRLFLAYASFKDFVVYQMDVKTNFLYGKIEEEVYVCQPPRFEDPDFPNRVYKVEKALSRLHQSPRAWYETLSTYLLDNEFQRRKIDKTLFIKRYKGDILLVQVYVDDIIFGSTKKKLWNAFKKLMHEKFQMRSMGELIFFLGFQVQQNKDGIYISQDKYVGEILKKFGFTEVKTASTPMETQKPLLKDKDGKEVDVHIYRSMIGSLMYLTSSTPNILFAVCPCARYQVNPKVSHPYVVKRIFRYLKGQPKLGLWYPKDYPFDLVAYTDSDYARCKKQTVVANSITEAEDCNEEKLIQMVKIHTDKNVADLLTKAFDVKKGKKSVRFMMEKLVIKENRQSDLVSKRIERSESEGFKQIVDFLNANPIRYALTINPTIYISCIEQFWSSFKAKTINGEVQLQALMDGKKIIITESTVRRDLQLEDAEGVDCLPNSMIFE